MHHMFTIINTQLTLSPLTLQVCSKTIKANINGLMNLKRIKAHHNLNHNITTLSFSGVYILTFRRQCHLLILNFLFTDIILLKIKHVVLYCCWKREISKSIIENKIVERWSYAVVVFQYNLQLFFWIFVAYRVDEQLIDFAFDIVVAVVILKF